MKHFNVVFAALLVGIGIQANARELQENTNLVRRLLAPVVFFDDEVAFDDAVNALPLPTEFVSENFDNFDIQGPCGVSQISSTQLGCWSSLRRGFSLTSVLPPGEVGTTGILAKKNGWPANEKTSTFLRIFFEKYAWDVKFEVFVVSLDPAAVIWVEAFGKTGESLGKREYRHGQFVGILGKDIRYVDIKADGEQESIDTLSWGNIEGGVIYDPHFKTWSGKWYDYMGECDLMLVHAPNFTPSMALDIHIRTKIRYDYSYIESAVVKIGNETFEVSSFGDYVLDGVANADLPNNINGFAIAHSSQLSDKENIFQIQVDDSEMLVFKTFKDMVSVMIDADDARFHGSRGMMGEFGTGKMLARDGAVLEDPSAFGAEWQVREDEPMLFRTIRAPQHPEACKLPGMKKDSRRRRLGGSIAREAAQVACAKWDADTREACIHDVMATGDLDLAAAGAF